MALDHYVPQVHLKQFLSPTLGGRQLYGIRKRDLLQFPCGTRDICRIENGNTNEFLVEPRIVEEFLRKVEPRYDKVVADLRNETVSTETIFVVSGFAAAVTACAPASVRIGVPSLSKVVEATARVLDRNGEIPSAPASLGGKSLTELLQDGSLKVTIDQKFPQALGIAGIEQRTSGFGNANWIVIHNPHTDSPFFTSDFPIAVHDIGGVFSRLIPLAPDLAVGIVSNPRFRGIVDLSFSGNRLEFSVASRNLVRTLNQKIVQCAEESVFFRDSHDWVADFVAKNARYRVDFVPQNFETDRGIITMSETRIVPWD